MWFHCGFARASMARHAAWLVCAAAFFAAPVRAESPPGLTLDTATQQAVERAPLLEARRSQSESARQELARAGALPDPQLTVGIDNLAVQGPGAYTAGGDSMTMRTVGISQALPSRSKRQAQRDLGQADADRKSTRLNSSHLAVPRRIGRASCRERVSCCV